MAGVIDVGGTLYGTTQGGGSASQERFSRCHCDSIGSFGLRTSVIESRANKLAGAVALASFNSIVSAGRSPKATSDRALFEQT